MSKSSKQMPKSAWRLATIVTSCLTALAMSPSSALAQNLIVNGDFSGGDSGFSSGHNCCSLSAAGTYVITTNPSQNHYLASSYGDNTTGTGNMMAVNGSTSTDLTVWESSVTVAPNSTYKFKGFVSIWFAAAPPVLEIYINGSLVSTVTAPLTTKIWESFEFEWNSAGSSTAVIMIKNDVTVAGGNDFALDDLSFELVSEPTIPQTCDDVWANDPTSPDGVYTLDIDGAGGVGPVSVYCDMTSQGGWTLIGSYPKNEAGGKSTLADYGDYAATTPDDPNIAGIYKGSLAVFHHAKEDVSCSTVEDCKTVYGHDLTNDQIDLIRASWAYSDLITELNNGPDTTLPTCATTVFGSEISECAVTAGGTRTANNTIDHFVGWQHDVHSDDGYCWVAAGTTHHGQGSAQCVDQGTPNGSRWALLWMKNTPPPSGPITCDSILTANPAASSGVYQVDPDGDGGAAPFNAYCDMTTDGGGWTLIGTYPKTEPHGKATLNDYPNTPDTTPANPTTVGLYKGDLSEFDEVKEQVSCLSETDCKSVYGKNLDVNEVEIIRKSWSYNDLIAGLATSHVLPDCSATYNGAAISECALTPWGTRTSTNTINHFVGWQHDVHNPNGYCWVAGGALHQGNGSAQCVDFGLPNGNSWALLWMR